jgi:hypothetical protein
MVLTRELQAKRWNYMVVDGAHGEGGAMHG